MDGAGCAAFGVGSPAERIGTHRNASKSLPLPFDVLYPNEYSQGMFTIRQTEEFVTWLDDIKDKRAQVRIAARLRQTETGNLGDWQSIEGEVSEMRVHYGPG